MLLSESAGAAMSRLSRIGSGGGITRSRAYKDSKNEKTGKSFDFPALVDYGEKLTNLIKDLNRLYLFAIEVL